MEEGKGEGGGGVRWRRERGRWWRSKVEEGKGEGGGEERDKRG